MAPTFSAAPSSIRFDPNSRAIPGNSDHQIFPSSRFDLAPRRRLGGRQIAGLGRGFHYRGRVVRHQGDLRQFRQQILGAAGGDGLVNDVVGRRDDRRRVILHGQRQGDAEVERDSRNDAVEGCAVSKIERCPTAAVDFKRDGLIGRLQRRIFADRDVAAVITGADDDGGDLFDGILHLDGFTGDTTGTSLAVRGRGNLVILRQVHIGQCQAALDPGFGRGRIGAVGHHQDHQIGQRVDHG